MLCPLDIASKDRLALQTLNIPEGWTNRTIMPYWLFPSRFPSKQRLTASRPGAIHVPEMPTKRRNAPDAHSWYLLVPLLIYIIKK